ncbi:MAG: helix-turn-helix transcriptional regulator [Alphaproteobacteria bacterium]|nr:helix-turn-helix transcriptional regulator [Alphaproteobacteria bacterium]
MKQKKSLRGRIEDNEPNPVDIHVGQRIRLRRTILHITQQQLAEMLGLTFQQVQKYEKGMNRVGASRLWDISRVLEVPMSFFFEDMDASVAQKSPRMLNMSEKGSFLAENQHSFDDDPMKRAETLELVRAYYKIPNRAIAKYLFNLIVALSKSTAGMAQVDANKDEDF